MLPTLLAISAIMVLLAGGLIVTLLVAWEERRRVPASLPCCAECGYDLAGLAPHVKCPECASTAPRRYRPTHLSPRRALSLRRAVVYPLLASFPAAALAALVPFSTSAQLVAGFFAPIIGAAALATLLRVVGAWLTPRGAHIATVGASGTLGLFCFLITLAACIPLTLIDPSWRALICSLSFFLAAPALWLGVRASLRAGWYPEPTEPLPAPDTSQLPTPDHHEQSWRLSRLKHIREESREESHKVLGDRGVKVTK